MEEGERLEVIRPGSQPAWIELLQGDITKARADAIVNAANSQLAGGGGVDGAIHRAAGPELMAELHARYAHCQTGSAVITGPGRLAEHGVKWVVHAVGPIWRGGEHNEPDLLESAYASAIFMADDAGAKSVALPAISTGIYGYPVAQAAAIAVRAAGNGLARSRNLDLAVFVLFSDEVLAAFRQALRDLASDRLA
ncbi:MAG TPA: macro domain-containing protein [Candidatus Limnocylindrales bacterium]